MIGMPAGLPSGRGKADRAWRRRHQRVALRRRHRGRRNAPAPEAGFTTYLLRHGYGRRWGISARSAARLIDLRAHLRRLTLAQFPDGQRTYFRFYDPQVLPALLESAHADQLARIYGPVEAYLCEVPEVFWVPGEEHRFRTFLRPAAPVQAPAEESA